MEIRKATMQDVDGMQQLIHHFAALGLMLPRNEKSLCEHLHSFTVAVAQDQVVGVAGLHILWRDLAEIRSLAVHPTVHGQGIGRQIVEQLLLEADELGIPQVLSLTYQTVFFDKLGFHVIEKETLPRKVWKDCIFCSKFDHCDEVAMVYYTAGNEAWKDMRMAETI